MRHLATTAALSLLVTSAALLAYDRLVVRSAHYVGVVDLAAIVERQHDEFAQLAAASRTDAERQQAVEHVQAFGQRLQSALAELAAECGCLVLERSAVAGSPRDALDLTPALEARLGARPEAAP